MNLRWKGGQPKSPNGPTPKTRFTSLNSFPLLELVNYKLLELNLIPFMLELLVNLVTPILECAGM